jgi:hypothetical protein
MKKIILIALPVLASLVNAQAQKTDTIKITPSLVNTKVLIPGTHRWLVYFKMGKDSSRSHTQFWTRSIDKRSYQGREAISVTQEWESNDTVVHKVYTVCDAKTFAPLYHESWTRKFNESSYDFLKKEAFVNGKPITAADADSNNVKRYKAFEASFNEYILDWHLDLETFPILPYQLHTTFAINFYDPGFGGPKWVYYTVTGTKTINGYDGQSIDCWILEHTDNDRMKNHEVFYISKKTKEVLKLEQEFGGRFRYKVKLSFSN